MRDAINNPGTVFHVRVVGSSGMVISHTCIECTTSPLGRFMDKGFIARQTFSIGVLAITKTKVAPVLTMVCIGGNDTLFLTGRADATICVHDMLNAKTVASSQLFSMGSGAHVEISQFI
jgi:hypothetical protein